MRGAFWVGGWVGGWVGRWVEEDEAVRMRYCMYGVLLGLRKTRSSKRTLWWVGGWVGGWEGKTYLSREGIGVVVVGGMEGGGGVGWGGLVQGGEGGTGEEEGRRGGWVGGGGGREEEGGVVGGEGAVQAGSYAWAGGEEEGGEHGFLLRLLGGCCGVLWEWWGGVGWGGVGFEEEMGAVGCAWSVAGTRHNHRSEQDDPCFRIWYMCMRTLGWRRWGGWVGSCGSSR